MGIPYGGYSYRSYAPEHFKVLRGIVLIVTKLNQNLSRFTQPLSF